MYYTFGLFKGGILDYKVLHIRFYPNLGYTVSNFVSHQLIITFKLTSNYNFMKNILSNHSLLGIKCLQQN